jgi:hypothetical protein
MTGERSKLNAYEDKLQNTCDENSLTYRIYREKYPISMTIRPAGGMDNQLSMLEKAEDNGYISPDASLVFAYRDGALEYRMSETFTISDALFNKLKNLFKSWLFMWLLLFNREAVVQQYVSHEAMTLIIGKREEKKPGAESTEASEETNEGDDLPPDDDGEGEDADHENDDADSDDDDDDAGDESAPSGLAEEAALVEEAITVVRKAGKASTGMLQKSFNIGYAKASRLIAALEARGIIGPFNGSSPREVLPVAGAANE